MRLFTAILFILLNVCFIESVNRTETGAAVVDLIKFKSDDSENATGSEIPTKSGDLSREEFENVDDDGSADNFITKSSVKNEEFEEKDASKEPQQSFPNEVFLTLRNLTSGGSPVFRGFTQKNDIEDLQASATDNVKVTANETQEEDESIGVNQRALRDAGHFHGEEEVYPPFKPNTIDNADFSDCARQGEWKPIGVDSSYYAHSSIDVGNGQGYQGQQGYQGLDGHSGHHGHGHGHGDILESVGSYPVANKIIPHWHDSFLSNSDQAALPPNHQPFPSGAGDSAHGASGFGSGSGGHVSGQGVGGLSGFGSASGHHSVSFGGGGSLSSAEQFQKIKSSNMLSPPPLPPVMIGKKPGYLKTHKGKYKFHHDKRKRPGGSGGGHFGSGGFGGGSSGSFSSHGSHGSFGGHIKHGGGGFGSGGSFSGGFKYGGGGFGGSSGYKQGFGGGSGHFKHGNGNFGGGSSGFSGGFKHGYKPGGGGFGGGSSGLSGPFKHGSGGFGGDAIVLTGHIKEANGGFGGGPAVFTGHIKDGGSGAFAGDGATILTGTLQEGSAGYGGDAAIITGHFTDGSGGSGGDASLFPGSGSGGHSSHIGGGVLSHLNQASGSGSANFGYHGSLGSLGYGGNFGGQSDLSHFNSVGGFPNVFSAASATDPKDILHYDGGHATDSILIQHGTGAGDSHSGSAHGSSGESSSHGYGGSSAGGSGDHTDSSNSLHYDSSAGGSDASHGHGTTIDSSSGGSSDVVQTTSDEFGHQTITTTTNLVHNGGSGSSGSGAHVGALAFPGGDLIFGSTVLLNHPADLQPVSPYPPSYGQEAASTNLVGTTAGGYSGLSSGGADNLITGTPVVNIDHSAGGGSSAGAVVVESGVPQTTFLTTHISHGAGDGTKLVPDSTYLPTQISQGAGDVSSASDSTYISGHVIDGGSPLADSANLVAHTDGASSSSYLSIHGGGGNSLSDSGFLSGHAGSDASYSGQSSYLSGHGGSDSSYSGPSSYHSGHGSGSGNSLSGSSGYSSSFGSGSGNSISGSSSYFSGLGGSGGHSGSSYFSNHGSGSSHKTRGKKPHSGPGYHGIRGGNSLSGHGTKGSGSYSGPAGSHSGHGGGSSFSGSSGSSRYHFGKGGGSGGSSSGYHSGHFGGSGGSLGSSGYHSGHGGGSGSSSYHSGHGGGSASSGYHSGHGGGSGGSSGFYSGSSGSSGGGGGLHSGSSGSSGFHSGHESGNGNAGGDSTFLSSQLHPGFVLQAHGVLDDSSTFTCGKHHDHNTNYHTATFQVADNDYPSSVDIIKYHGDAAVIVRSDPPFQNEIYPERKNYDTDEDSDTGSEGRQNESAGQVESEEGRSKQSQLQEVEADTTSSASQLNVNNRKPQTFTQETEPDAQQTQVSSNSEGEHLSQTVVDEVREDSPVTSEISTGQAPSFKKIKFHQRPGKPQFYQKSPKNLGQGKFPLKQKQTHNLHEFRGERYIPLVDVSSSVPHFNGTPRPRTGAKLHRYNGNQHVRKPEAPKVVRVMRN